MEDKNVDLTYMIIRKMANGWMVDLSTDYENRAAASTSKMYVFRNLDEMFAWIRQQVE